MIVLQPRVGPARLFPLAVTFTSDMTSISAEPAKPAAFASQLALRTNRTASVQVARAGHPSLLGPSPLPLVAMERPPLPALLVVVAPPLALAVVDAPPLIAGAPVPLAVAPPVMFPNAPEVVPPDAPLT